MDNSIADKIKHYRKIRNLSQDELASLSGINVSTIKKYESGFRNPKPDQLLKIANALDISINYFVDFDIKNVGDVLALVLKLEKQTDLKIIADKDENGLYIPSSIKLIFESNDINNALAQYMNLQNKEISKNNDKTVESQSYLVQLDSLQFEVETQKKN